MELPKVPLPLILSKINSWTGSAIAIVILVGCFMGGWFAHRWFTKPVEHTVTQYVTVAAQPPAEKPQEENHGVVNPGTVVSNHHPQPPANTTISPLEHPSTTTVVTVPVPTPMKLQVFHQTELKWAKEGDSYNIWDEGRVWTLDDKGQTIPGVTAVTTYSKSTELKLPVTFSYSAPKDRTWAVGGIYKALHPGYGAFVDKDFMMFRVGAEVLYSKATVDMAPHTDLNLKFGIRF